MTVVDHQTHWLPRPCLDALLGREGYPRSELRDGRYVLDLAPNARVTVYPELADLDRQLADAREHGIDVLVSSPTQLGEGWELDRSEACELLELSYEELARAQRDYAGRFAGLALLPLNSPDDSLRLLDRAITGLGLAGVCMLATIDSEPIATEATLPVFERIEQLGVPIFLHPAQRSPTLAGTASFGRGVEQGLGWMYHTSLAALNLIVSGTLDACPGLRIVHPHLGGVLPYVLGRVELVTGRVAAMQPEPPRHTLPIHDYLRERFFVDTVGATPGALGLAIETYGCEHVLFATDYPFVPMGLGCAYVPANADEADAAAIMGNVAPGLRVPSAG